MSPPFRSLGPTVGVSCTHTRAGMMTRERQPSEPGRPVKEPDVASRSRGQVRAGGASGLEQVPGEGCPPPAALLQGGRARLPRWSSVSEPAQPPPRLPAPPARPCVLGFSAWGQGGRSDEVSAGMSWMQLVGVESGVWASCPASPAPSPGPRPSQAVWAPVPASAPWGPETTLAAPVQGPPQKPMGKIDRKYPGQGGERQGPLSSSGVRQQPHRPPCPNPVTPARPRGEGSVQRCVTGHYSPSVPPN